MADISLVKASQGRAGTDSEYRESRQSDVNVGKYERLASLAVGVALGAYGLFRAQRGRLPLVALGSGLVVRGVTGRCQVYSLLGVSMDCEQSGADQTVIPARHGFKVEQAVTIKRSPEDIYKVWRDLANLPKVMQHLVRIDVLDAQRSHWVVQDNLGRNVEWDAEVFNERANEVIAWRSLPGGDVDTTGSVHFKALDKGRGTEIAVSLKYDPPGGKLGDWVAGLFGDDLDEQIADDLCEFKRFMEAGEIPVATQQDSGTSSL